MNANLFHRVAAEAPGKLCSDAELKALRKLQADWTTARDTVSGCDINAAFNCFLDEQKRAKLAAEAGKLLEFRTHSREEFEFDFLRRADAGRERQREVTREAAKVARGIADKFAALCNKVASDTEQKEAKAFAEFGIAYLPSNLVVTLRGLGDRVRRLVPTSEYSAASPQSMLPFLAL
jgi:hypothetical protein